MIRLVAEAWGGLIAVTRAIAFRDDWQAPLNLSAAGLIRSFSAALFTLPIFWFTLQGAMRLSADLAPDASITYDAGDFLADMGRIWLAFPLIAALLVRLAGVKHRYVHWLVLHNWAVLFLFAFQGLIFVLFLAGLANAETTAFIYTFAYLFFRFFLHARIAMVALDLPAGRGIALGLIPVFADFMLIQLLR
ncbi:hypothetical protein [Hyphobacterium sp.]|uniref:hypothetical protein n=1 Tax=Hyphobacterium sp. TaxID=2004662 RepID=UPI003B52DCDE